MLLAPAGPALRAATLFRIVSDLTDALAFGINAPDRRAQGARRSGATFGYAALNAVSLRWAGRVTAARIRTGAAPHGCRGRVRRRRA